MNFVNRSLKGTLLKNALRHFLYEKKRKTDFFDNFFYVYHNINILLKQFINNCLKSIC